MEEKQDYHKKPQWYVDEISDIRSHIASKASIETINHMKDTQSSIIKYGIGAIVGFTSSILGLYVLYYSGLAELKAQVLVIDNRLSDVKDDVVDIKKVLSSAEITQ